MCFSASASFIAGATLTIIGVASIKKAKSKKELPFATIPLIFGVQQLFEGLLWIALPDSDKSWLASLSSFAFLFFAQVVWPFWVPYSILSIEDHYKRRKLLKILLIAGAIVSGYLAFCLFYFPVSAKIEGMHIMYIQDYPAALSDYGALLYILATISPPFFSRIKYMWALGLAILISYLITHFFYTGYIVSVWCFFASIISIAVLGILHRMQKGK